MQAANLPPRGFDPRDLARRARLGDLLLGGGFGAEAALTVAPGVSGSEPVYRAHAARAELARHDPEQAAVRLGAETEIDGVYGPWFGLRGRLLEKSDPKAAARAFGLGLASDPLAEEVACRGRFSIGGKLDEPAFLSELLPVGATAPTAQATGARAPTAHAAGGTAALAQFSNWSALCDAARNLPRD
jgi:hypothetical protein